jgi:hypothetical protein
MMVMRIAVSTLAVLAFLGAGSARADWLTEAWSDDSVAAHGNPSITVRSDGLSVSLPSVVIDHAHAEGLSTKDALVAFLGRYSPQCSHILDLNGPQPNLKVALSLQDEVPLGDLTGAAQGQILGALQGELAAQPRSPGVRPAVPHITHVFTVSDQHVDFVIDYAPARNVRCIEGPAETS